MKSFLHPRHGSGTLLAEVGGLLLIQFASGIHSCEPESVRALQTPDAPTVWSPALPTLARALGLAIRSVNDQWGVFSASRIALLPHQLWVCKRVLEREPSRWLIADDVGLGKSIEAGLIISALRGAGRLGRLLIIAPAGLCAQWQARLVDQFDFRTTIHESSADTPTSHFWEQHHAVVASLQTLREDRDGRHERMMAVAWDVVIVDEAHHVHADAKGWTKAYHLLHKLVSNERARSVLFFTGTPHRGKDDDFLAILSLLRPDAFGPKHDVEEQLCRLSEVMIRNNKAAVTDMRGRRLFQPTTVRTLQWAHSPEEAEFYARLSRYIAEGRAFASGLRGTTQRTAVLVLIAIQKLASSSVAAVRRALASRLVRARVARDEGARLLAQLDALPPPGHGTDMDEDRRLELEDRLAGEVLLGANEVPDLEEMLAHAARITSESRIAVILECLATELRDRPVLFFTEYKATQALLVAALRAHYGPDCVTFINGDGWLDLDVVNGLGPVLRSDRSEAAAAFNAGTVRFLVSTEAAGEGIDLHGACWTLIHADIPWNPMRMHQRAGRLNRFGQTRAVEVLTLQNPDTVEGRIYALLQQKLARITSALTAAMEEPEDMMQLVLGLESPSFFQGLVSEAPRDLPGVKGWFDANTKTFAGEGAIGFVKALLGNVARFDFQTTLDELPQLDLGDLLPFMKAMLTLNRRDFTGGVEGLEFRTPDMWRAWGVLGTYRGDKALVFNREGFRRGHGVLAGVGFHLVDKALAQALQLDVVATRVAGIAGPIVILGIEDMETASRVAPGQITVGVSFPGTAQPQLLRDEALIKLLNPLLQHPRSPALSAMVEPPTADVASTVRAAEDLVTRALDHLRLPLKRPRVKASVVLWHTENHPP